MNPKELRDIIQRINKLPDESLLRILKAATSELLRRNEKELRFLKQLTIKR